MRRFWCIFIIILFLLLYVRTNPIIEVKGEWESIGPDGGDMHFVYITSNHILFASHGFGGVWRSDDRGDSWRYVENNEWIDTNFMAMDECNGKIIAGGNNGLWISEDGLNWSRILTGNESIDGGSYEVVSIIAFSEDNIVFSARALKGKNPHGFFWLSHGNLLFHEIPEKGNGVVMLSYGKIEGSNLIFVSSSERGLFTYEANMGRWNKILDENTTRVFVRNEKVYVGTIGNWYFRGEYRSEDDKWIWEHIVVEGEECGVATFIVPDPYTPEWLWIGASGHDSLFSCYTGTSFVACGYYDREWKEFHSKRYYATMIAIDKNGSGEREEFYTVETKYGRVAKYAFVPQASSDCIQRTTDGGKTWERAYNGIYADTINKINLLHGLRDGEIMVTCMSGNQITDDMGNSWEPGIDFVIGNIGYGLPGYAWGAESPPERIKGKYDLLVATGYPSESLTGNGVYAIDVDNLNRIERIFDAPSFDLVILDRHLYIGRMDRGVSILDLDTMKVEDIKGIPENEAGINVKEYNGIVYISTIRGINKNSDSYFFDDKNAVGGLYVYDGGKVQCLYHGKRIISFSIKGEKMYALTCDGRLLYFKNNNKIWEVNLTSATYSDMAVDWDKRIIYVSTFDAESEGVLYATFYYAKTGKFSPLEGLPTNRVRCLLLVNGTLFAGTEGHSVWRITPQKHFIFQEFHKCILLYVHPFRKMGNDWEMISL